MTKNSTALRSAPLWDFSNAALVAGENVVKGSKSKTFMMLKPKLHCLPWLVVPEGFHSIGVRWKKFIGILEPGFHCAPCWVQISHLVSKQFTVFDIPVKECPTQDNVMVKIDVSTVLHVRDDPDDVVNFVYKLGPQRLEEILQAFIEETVRELARSKSYDSIYDLMEKSTWASSSSRKPASITKIVKTPIQREPKVVVVSTEKPSAQQMATATSAFLRQPSENWAWDGEQDQKLVSEPTAVPTAIIAPSAVPMAAAIITPAVIRPAAVKVNTPPVSPNQMISEDRPAYTQQSPDSPISKFENDDHGSFLENAKFRLNSKLHPYGVEVYSITITGVNLPTDFENQMETTTSFDSKAVNMRGNHDYTKLCLKDSETRQKAEQQSLEAKQEVISHNSTRIAEQKKLISGYEAQTELIVAKITEDMNAKVAVIKTSSELNVAKLNRSRDVTLSRISALADAEEQKILTEAKSYLRVKTAEGNRTTATLQAQVTGILAEAEGVASKSLTSTRHYQEQSAKINLMHTFGDNKDVVLLTSNPDNKNSQIIGASFARKDPTHLSLSLSQK